MEKCNILLIEIALNYVFIAVLNRAAFTLLRFALSVFVDDKRCPFTLLLFSNEYAMKTIGVHFAPAKRFC